MSGPQPDALPIDLRPILAIRVLGTPRPKGSLRFVTKTYAKEQNPHSGEWRAAVADAAYEAIRCRCPDNCQDLRSGYPYAGPVKVAIRLEFVPPKKRQPLPGNRTTGDLDKQARNILDALQDAGVLKDDAAAVDLSISKRYTVGAPGAAITVWPAAADDAVSMVDAVPEIPLPGSAAATAAARRGSGAMLP